MATSFIFGASKVSATGFSLNPLQPMVDDWNAVKDWFKNLPHTIAESSVELMAKLYELCSSLILKTPLWLFDNDWFKNTTYKFSLIAIGIVAALSMLEGIKRMLPKNKRKPQPMELVEIGKRWFLAAGVMSVAPFLFQKAFQLLNWVSDTLIALGADNMRAAALPINIKFFDVAILVIFDVLLIATLIPVLWKNGRRFFDLLVLGATTPFALTAWIFDSYRPMFDQWWKNVKHLALVQVFHALFLLVLGWFIFGVPTPDDFVGMVVKILIVIGGFSRLQSPPVLISKHLDNGKGFDEVTGGYAKMKNGFRRNVEFGKALITKNPKKLFETFSGDRMSSAKILTRKGEEKESPTSYSKKGSFGKTKKRK